MADRDCLTDLSGGTQADSTSSNSASRRGYSDWQNEHTPAGVLLGQLPGPPVGQTKGTMKPLI